MNKINFHKMAFEGAEVLHAEWARFCHSMRRPEAIEIGPTAHDAFMLSMCSGGILPGAGSEINRELTETGHWMMRWRRYGYPTFHLTHSLVAALLLTDCSSVSCEDFRFPFPSFLITMPCPKSPLAIDTPTGQSEVRWISVHTMDYPVDEDAPVLEDRLRSEDRFSKDGLNVRYQHSSVVRLIESDGLAAYERKILPNDDQTLESWLMTGLPIGAAHHLPSTSLDAACAKAGLRLVANLSLYLDAQRQAGVELPERYIRNPKKKKGRDKPGRKSGPAMPPAWILGRDIKLDAELRAAATQVARPASQQRAEWTLQSQHVVRGHWKSQRHGPGRSLQKKIRIEPYWRGPRLSEAVLRSFTEKS